MAPLPAGKLDRRVTSPQASETTMPSGQRVPSWSTLATVWAWKKDIRSRERFAAQQEIAEETTVFVIRYRDDVTVEMQLTHDGKTYRIEGLAELGRREGLEITATAILPGALP